MMWIVTTDEMDASTEEFDTEEGAIKVYRQWVEAKETNRNYRIYIAEVKEYFGNPW